MPHTPPDVKSIFGRALEIESPADRAAFIDEACGADAVLRAEVDGLLATLGRAGEFMRQPAAAIAAGLTASYQPVSEGPGTIIGPYKLLQQIGEGGMGVVFMAEQSQPIQRKVALKIIKPGMDSKQVIARFEAERQALAMMDHQSIARVLDAGMTDSGRPYFVMELIHGVPIVQFCDDRKLTPSQRLELFIPVCQAIQHAHQKGIIHRDIKPSNILVTMYDDKPVPKVIDFGVAKAVEQRLTEKTLFTQFGTMVGTFEYMSPEQAESNALGVDTRSDIFSLGVLLYELLSGSTPLDRQRLREVAFGEIIRLIKEEEPPRPSVRLGSSQNLPKIAAACNTEPAKLAKLVRGELDWIVMKCLEKDRTRRYETASNLAHDVERYLRDEPVEACPPSASYRLRKFARKHMKALATMAAFVILLVAGVVMSSLLAIWATSAEHEANRQRIASDAARDEARLIAYASGMGLAQRAWEENNVARTRELLEEVPKEAAGKDLRGFEWYYLTRLCHADERTIEAGHGGQVSSVAFSPDGQRLASGGGYTVKVWDSTTGKQLFVLKAHEQTARGLVSSVAFSPDGQRLVSGSWDKTVTVWDITTGQELFVLKGHDREVFSVAFSQDGRSVASGDGSGTVKFWDSVTGKERSSFKRHSDGVFSLAFSPDGQRLALGSWDRTARIWDSGTGKELVWLKGHDERVTSVAFSPDGLRLASGSWDHTAKIWDSLTGEELLSLKGHAGAVKSVAFSPDGRRLASGSDDGTIKLWDSVNGKELWALKGAGPVESVAFNPDGRCLASGGGDAVKIWNNANATELFDLKGHVGQVISLAFSPDGQRLVSGSYDTTVKVWDSTTGKELVAPKSDIGAVLRSGSGIDAQSVAFSPDGQRLASGNGDGTIKVWDSVSAKELFSLDADADSGHHSGSRVNVESVAFSPDGQFLASGSGDGTIKVWDSMTGNQMFSRKGHAATIKCLAFSPDGRRLASGGGYTVNIWDSGTGKELASFKGHSGIVTSVAFSPDGRHLASGSYDRTLKVWDIVTGIELAAFKGHNDRVSCVAFSPDGRRVASGSYDQTVKIWDSSSGKELFAFKGHAGRVWGVAFSPDGQRLASANDDGSIIQWETTTVSPEIQQRRAINQFVAEQRRATAHLVAKLFAEMLLRADVLERLRTEPGMSRSRLQEALAFAQIYAENPSTLHRNAWELVKLPNHKHSDYLKAVRYSEAACKLDPKNGLYLNALGVAYYRAGNDQKALATLQSSDSINKAEFNGSIPADLAFLVMTQKRLGHTQEAHAELLRLQERMKESRWSHDVETQAFLHEAESLLANPKTPDSNSTGSLSPGIGA